MTKHDAQLRLHADAQRWPGGARIVFGAVCCLFVAARLWRLTQFNLGRDELFSLETARLGWRALVGAVVADAVHPPLFYLLLKIWLAVGGADLRWLKLFPVLAGVAAIIPCLLLCRELRLRPFETNLALALLAVNGYLVAYAHELRMYSLLFLFSLCALWTFVKFWNTAQPTKLDLLALVGAHVLLVYTQYYGWLIVCVELLFVLGWRRDKARTFMAAVAVVMLTFAPWAGAVAHALNTRTVDLQAQLSWHYRPDASSIAAYYALLNGPFSFPRSTTVSLFVFGLVIVWGLFDVQRNQRAADDHNAPAAARFVDRSPRLVFYFLFALAVLPVAVAFVVSRGLAQSVWHTRYLIISAAPYLLLTACALARLRPRWLRWALTSFVIAWAALSGFTEMRRTDTHIAWDALAHELHTTEQARIQTIKVYMLDDFPRYPMNFYLRAAGDERFEFVRINASDLSTLADAHFWLVYDEGAWPRAGVSPQELLRGRGYEIGAGFDSGPRGRRYILFPAWRR